MLNRLKSYLIGTGKNIISSIGFIPTLITIALTILAVVLILIDTPERDWLIIDAVPLLDVSYASTARDLVTAFLAGTISLIIFSFTMMMFVLQQTATNYSSKIVGGIIAMKSNQVVLGTYVGTIIYMILTLIQIKEDDQFDQVPQLPIYIGLILFIVCVIMFVKFINDIYNSVQIYQVIERIYHKTAKKLKNLRSDKFPAKKLDQVDFWHTYKSGESGYFQDISIDALLDIAQKNDLIIKSIIPRGFYHGIGEPLFMANKHIEDKKIIKGIEQSFIFYTGEKISDNYFFGVRQLSEVAVQSLSTGINAPDVAIACLDYIGDLFVSIVNNERNEIFRDKKEKLRVVIPSIPVDELFEMCISPIRIYGKKDLNILISLLNFLKRIGYADDSYKYQKLINEHFSAIMADGENGLENDMDKNSLINKARKTRTELPDYFVDSFSEK
jgi:uncharacterized membrane protein